MTDLALIRVAKAEEHPYDMDEDGGFDPAPNWQTLAARAVLADLTDRRGVKYALSDIDEEIRVEIVESLAAVIEAAHENFSEPPKADDDVDQQAQRDIEAATAGLDEQIALSFDHMSAEKDGGVSAEVVRTLKSV